jgi:hypothetical protein
MKRWSALAAPFRVRRQRTGGWWASAKHVADITRAVIAGPGGRVSKKVESLTDNETIESVRGFLDVLSIAFAALAEITEEEVDNYDPWLSGRKKNEPPAPPTKAMKLRESSLLGSVGMLRVLGGVYRNLREAGAEEGDIQEFFKRLDRHMSAPSPRTASGGPRSRTRR